jgi:transcriptional regulator with GAF, ATPase, and Fis domain
MTSKARLRRDCDAEGLHSPIPNSCNAIMGQSSILRDILHRAEIVARTESTVLICGETGTGKELVARAIHEQSDRAAGSFIKLNCAAIPANLLESELFGHERGAFTGAVVQRTGRFELAQNGTLFLDEIGEMALELQPKLLRMVQEREFERVGSSCTLHSNARLVAATHRDLMGMVDDGMFREDLYYRLSVFPIRVPPLRERRGDIRGLALAFATQFAKRMQRDIRGVAPCALVELENYDWPGNVRELQNVIERAIIMAPSSTVELSLPADFARRRVATSPPRDALKERSPDALNEIQRAHILTVLDKTNWIVGGSNGAAARLGMKRSTLNFRIKKLGIERVSGSRHSSFGRPNTGSQTE